MKKQIFFLFSLFVFHLSSAFALDVTGLRTEDYRNPVGIDKSVVHFSWQLESEQRGVVQTSYNVQIATDAAFADVVWTSGSVSSDASVFVEANGFTPAAETRYYWRVTVSDNRGNKATSTEKAYFDTGLMTTGWSGAKWIKYSPYAQGEAPDEITDYTVEGKVRIEHTAAGLCFASMSIAILARYIFVPIPAVAVIPVRSKTVLTIFSQS